MSNNNDQVMIKKEKVIQNLLEHTEDLLANKFDRARVKSVQTLKQKMNIDKDIQNRKIYIE